MCTRTMLHGRVHRCVRESTCMPTKSCQFLFQLLPIPFSQRQVIMFCLCLLIYLDRHFRAPYPVGPPTIQLNVSQLNLEPEGIHKVRVLPPPSDFFPSLPMRMGNEGRLCFALCRGLLLLLPLQQTTTEFSLRRDESAETMQPHG